jgi:hypothetical protein
MQQNIIDKAKEKKLAKLERKFAYIRNKENQIRLLRKRACKLKAE